MFHKNLLRNKELETSLSTSPVARLALAMALTVATVAVPTADAQRAGKELRKDHRPDTAELAFADREGTPKTAILLNADGSQGDVIHYVDYDGEAIVEGDIILHVDEHGHAAFDRQLLEGGTAGLEKSTGRTWNGRQWPGGIVPYEVDSGLSSQKVGWINDAIDEWESLTSIRLVPRSGEADYLYFSTHDSCSSSIGRQGGKQNIKVNGCSQGGSAIHEIGHAIGLFHEHTRADRDSYVEIHWNEIKSGKSGNFEQYSAADGMDLGDYDYGSIMHYSCWGFSVGNDMTIEPPDTNRCYTNGGYGDEYMGQRLGLSSGDVQGVAMLYPNVQMFAMNSAGNIQGTVLYDVDETDGSTTDIGGLQGAYNCVTDMDFEPGTPLLYAVSCEQPGAGSTLLRIEWFFGLTLPVAAITDGGSARLVTSLAFDPITDELYAIDYSGKGYGNTLLTINAASGAVSEIADLWGDQSEASSIAFREDGKLFAVNNTNNAGRGDTLFTIDIATGQARDIASLSGDRTAADTLRFGANGTLFGSRRNNSDGTGTVLFLVDTDDGATSDIDFFTGDRTHATSMAIRNTESASPDYKMMAMNSAGSAQGTVLYEVNEANTDTHDVGSPGCVTDLDYLPGTAWLFSLGCEAAGAGSTLSMFAESLSLPVMPRAVIQDGSGMRLMTSLAFDSDDSKLYAIDHVGKGYGNTLVEINPATGMVTEIADLWGDQTEASSLAFDANGNTLYGMNNVDNQGSGDLLFEIDLSDGETTNIGTLTGSRTRAVTIRFAPDGTLYGTRRNNSDGNGSVLFIIDPEDATTRDVGFFHGDRTHATSMAIRKQ